MHARPPEPVPWNKRFFEKLLPFPSHFSHHHHHRLPWMRRPAPAQGGLGYFEGHFNVYCDDATQNAYHTHSVLDATIASFLEKRPWLASARPSFIQSDNASNYRSPTTEVGIASVGTRCFSEPSMGKDEGDGNGAVIKGRMNRVRDERNGIESMA